MCLIFQPLPCLYIILYQTFHLTIFLILPMTPVSFLYEYGPFWVFIVNICFFMLGENPAWNIAFHVTSLQRCPLFSAVNICLYYIAWLTMALNCPHILTHSEDFYNWYNKCTSLWCVIFGNNISCSRLRFCSEQYSLSNDIVCSTDHRDGHMTLFRFARWC